MIIPRQVIIDVSLGEKREKQTSQVADKVPKT